MKSRLLIILAAVIVTAILLIITIDSANLDRLCAEQGGIRNGDVCMIEIIPVEETAYEILGINNTIHPSIPLEISIKINDDGQCENSKGNTDARILDASTGSSIWQTGSEISCLAVESGGYYYLISTGQDPIVIHDVGKYLFQMTIGSHYLEQEFSVRETFSGVSLDRTVYPVPFDSESDVGLSQIKPMKPNSMEFFYYPNPEDTANRDVFQKFILIRLPEELGGGADDVSAFRAYSALSVGEHCQMRYWPDNGRQVMMDPCWGSMYRPIDGLMIVGPKPIVNTAPVALPYLDLSIDESGSLYVESPVWTLDKNGVIGIGRSISMQEIHDGSALLVDLIMKSHPNHPKIPVTFGTHTLTQIHSSGSLDAMYFDFSPVSDYVYLTVDNTSAQDQKYFPNLASRNSEVWQIEDVIIQISGTGFDENDSQLYYKPYKAIFLKDGFTFTVEGKNMELIKRGIVANFFSENDYDDLVLISSGVENEN